MGVMVSTLPLDGARHHRVEAPERGPGDADGRVGASEIQHAVCVEVAGEDVGQDGLVGRGGWAVHRGRDGAGIEALDDLDEVHEVQKVLAHARALLEGVGEEEALAGL